MPSVSYTETTLAIMQQVAELRLPEETVLLINGERDAMQAKLMDSKLVNKQGNTLLKAPIGPVKCFIISDLFPQLKQQSVCVKAERIKPSFQSDASSLEAQLGYRFTCRLETADNCTQVYEKLNV